MAAHVLSRSSLGALPAHRAGLSAGACQRGSVSAVQRAGLGRARKAAVVVQANSISGGGAKFPRTNNDSEWGESARIPPPHAWIRPAPADLGWEDLGPAPPAAPPPPHPAAHEWLCRPGARVDCSRGAQGLTLPLHRALAGLDDDSFDKDTAAVVLRVLTARATQRVLMHLEVCVGALWPVASVMLCLCITAPL